MTTENKIPDYLGSENDHLHRRVGQLENELCRERFINAKLIDQIYNLPSLILAEIPPRKYNSNQDHEPIFSAEN